jgi:hypothetical protein
MEKYIRTEGTVVNIHGERHYGVKTPIGKVVHGFVERRDRDLLPGLGERVDLQFKPENMGLARITGIVGR